MLRPFRVCSLQSPGPTHSKTGPGAALHGAVVRVSASEYDDNLTKHPETALKYFDEEDGEKITVGSSIELIQCLEAACGGGGQATSPAKTPKQTSLGAPDLLSFDPTSLQLRMFGIENAGKSFEIWEAIRLRTWQAEASLDCGQMEALDLTQKLSHHFPVPGHDTQSINGIASGCVNDRQYAILGTVEDFLDGTKVSDLHRTPTVIHDFRNEQRDHLEDRRALYFESSRPPQMQPVQSHPSNDGVISGWKTEVEASYPRFAVNDSQRDVKNRASMPSFQLTKEPRVQASYSDPLDVKYMRNGCPTACVQSGMDEPVSKFVHDKNLTNEGKKQAEAAGEMLRLRLRSQQPGRPSHGKGVYENRWSTYSGVHRAPFRNSVSAKSLCSEASQKGQAVDMKPSQLQLFEEEIAKAPIVGPKIPIAMDTLRDPISAQTNHENGVDQFILPSTTRDTTPEALQQQSLESIQADVNRLESVASSLKTAEDPKKQKIYQILELSLHTALRSFSVCLQNIADAAQEAATSSPKPGDQALDDQVFDNALSTLRNISSSISRSDGCVRKVNMDVSTGDKENSSISRQSSQTDSHNERYATGAYPSQKLNPSTRLLQDQHSRPSTSKYPSSFYESLEAIETQRLDQRSTSRDDQHGCKPKYETRIQSSNDDQENQEEPYQKIKSPTALRTPIETFDPNLTSTSGHKSQAPLHESFDIRFPPLDQFENDGNASGMPSSSPNHPPPSLDLPWWWPSRDSTTSPFLCDFSTGPAKIKLPAIPDKRCHETPSEVCLDSVLDSNKPIEKVDQECAAKMTTLDQGNGPMTQLQSELYAMDHVDDATVQKIQHCVEQLQNLGFESATDGGIQRLVIYAQAAEGDLVDAIEMIDDERRAFSEVFPSNG